MSVDEAWLPRATCDAICQARWPSWLTAMYRSEPPAPTASSETGSVSVAPSAELWWSRIVIDAVGADSRDDSRQGHDAVGSREVRDDHWSRHAQPVGDVDDDRCRGERGVELGVQVGRLGHGLPDRGGVIGRTDAKPSVGERLVDLEHHDLTVDDHDECRPIGDQRLRRRHRRGDAGVEAPTGRPGPASSYRSRSSSPMRL